MEDNNNNTEQKETRQRGNGWLSGFINKMNLEKQPPMETSLPVQQSVFDKPIQPLQRMCSLGDNTTKPTTTKHRYQSLILILPNSDDFLYQPPFAITIQMK